MPRYRDRHTLIQLFKIYSFLGHHDLSNRIYVNIYIHTQYEYKFEYDLNMSISLSFSMSDNN